MGWGLILGAVIVATSIGEEFTGCSEGPSQKCELQEFLLIITLDDVTVWD